MPVCLRVYGVRSLYLKTAPSVILYMRGVLRYSASTSKYYWFYEYYYFRLNQLLYASLGSAQASTSHTACVQESQLS